MGVDEKEFRLAMGHFASGVTVVTTQHDGRLYGMTVASFASLSLDPPLVLVCLENGVQTHDAIQQSAHFGVSILAHDQAELSNRFASRVEDRFDGVALRHGSLGDPLLHDALTSLQCRVHSILPGGDHAIFVGEVLETYTRDAAPLLYFRSRYHGLRDE